ncbi:SGNH/GDSL hydrolase family protein [Clostridiaceae bacterium NSJ-31]|uniref:SGNH/GDSL hydrolase family protein n=1 Tax=Ligaoa zhengdingensis TaxID=2763658 RepID=A0A926E200_9FIRM|nr:SGNH/GDSL hydrolase family protein [Ligaoa zhengdingensis]MBC8547619.1 SGNH/GDSL hydrolase family protein [Ligaoa zhengdingensis]
MAAANPLTYLEAIRGMLAKQWPDNRTVNLVCHGHSVPAGYFATPFVNTFEAYPALLHRAIKERFPFAVLNVIVTAIGGENSVQGAARFDSEVLNHRPDVLTIDYALNDRMVGLDAAEAAWRSMIERALAVGVKVILLTPTWDETYFDRSEGWEQLTAHAAQVRRLAAEYGVGLADSFAAFEGYLGAGGALTDLLSHVNHPSGLGHRLVCRELAAFFRAK